MLVLWYCMPPGCHDANAINQLQCSQCGWGTTQHSSVPWLPERQCCLPRCERTNNDVRFIINGKTAQSVFGTPFGNVPRNALRDAISNRMDASIYKDIKLGERVTFQIHATALNALNHFNFTAVDVFTEDAGLTQSFGSGFGNPAFSTAAGRSFFIGGKITF